MSSDVTFEKVMEAVTKLTAEGRPVTVREARAVLGAGSMSTISQHLCRVGTEGI